MPGTRSVYFNPKSEAIVILFQGRTFHKFSRAVCLIIEEYDRQREEIASLKEEIQLLKISKLKEDKDDD